MCGRGIEVPREWFELGPIVGEYSGRRGRDCLTVFEPEAEAWTEGDEVEDDMVSDEAYARIVDVSI